MSVDFLVVDYDVAASTRRVAELGLPRRCLHAPPPLHRQARTAARRLVRRR